MRVYLAASYGRRDEMEAAARQLCDAGYETTARWIEGRHETPPDGMVVGSVEHWGWAAQEDVDDIRAADCVVSFTNGSTRARGGRHVEFGIAIAFGKRLIVIGERENVFHCLPNVTRYDTLDEFIGSAGGQS